MNVNCLVTNFVTDCLYCFNVALTVIIIGRTKPVPTSKNSHKKAMSHDPLISGSTVWCPIFFLLLISLV